MAARKTAAVTKLADKQHQLSEIESTLAERRARIVELDDRIARVSTDLEIAVGEARVRLADLQAEIDAANAMRDSMLTCTIVTMHADTVHLWLLEATPGERGCVVSLDDEGAIHLEFLDKEGNAIPGPEEPKPPELEHAPTEPPASGAPDELPLDALFGEPEESPQ